MSEAGAVVAVLGTGIMGYPMAGNLLRAGFTVRVWNRTRSKAEPLAEQGATVLDTPAQAADGADFVLSMLADGAAVRSAMTGGQGALGAMSSDAIWLQMSTVGVQQTEQLAALAAEFGVDFVDAPVLGTKQPAVDGKLVILESGPAHLSERCAAVFAAVGARTQRVGAAGAGNKLKLVANNWVLAITNGTAECIRLAGALGLEPEQFLDSVAGGAPDVPYLHLKGKAMIDDDYPVSFPLSLAAKDARLVIEAAGGALDLGGTRVALHHLERAEQAGHGELDMAALYYGIDTEPG